METKYRVKIFKAPLLAIFKLDEIGNYCGVILEIFKRLCNAHQRLFAATSRRQNDAITDQ